MDDHSQPDLQRYFVRDCSTAECLQDDHAPQELSTAEVRPSIALRPFVWQCGRRLLLLEREIGSWVLAELEFEPAVCRYSELRRAYYDWEREAVGALLSRTIAYGADATAETADLLDVWMRCRR